MKTKAILLGMMLPIMAASYAQKGVQDGSRYGHGEDSIQCRQNLSLLSTYSKQADYKSALPFWEKAYAECPAASKSLYIYGAKIVAWEINNEPDALKKEKLFDKLMKVYDDRIKYYGNDQKQGRKYILGRKAIDYIQYVPINRDPQKETAYKWLNEVLDESSDASLFQQYFILADGIYRKKKDSFREEYISDYLKISPMMQNRINSGVATDSIFVKVKLSIDAMFASSKVADCKTLDGIYASQVDAQKSDKDFLNMVLSLYNIADCQESSVYFKASAYKHKIEPSASSAKGLAVQAYNSKDFSKAISYFKEAISLESANEEKSKLQMKIALIYSEMNNYQQSRAAAQSALSYNSSNSDAYILIANLYAANYKSISDDAVLQLTAFWAATDKLEKAKAVNPLCASSVNKIINSYKEYFPPSSELFMRNIKAGDTYTVPGWIGEKTTVRVK